MAITLGSTRTQLNGATPVTVVAAPAASTVRVVLAIRLNNTDTAAITPSLTKDISGTAVQAEKEIGLAVGDTWRPVNKEKGYMFLTATTHSLLMVLGGAAATANPYCVAEWLDRT
jgi:hypothetical protein